MQMFHDELFVNLAGNVTNKLKIIWWENVALLVLEVSFTCSTYIFIVPTAILVC